MPSSLEILNKITMKNLSEQDFSEQRFMSLGPHGFHRIVYYEWGKPDNDQVLLCVHGMTRNGRDFDDFARALMDEYRVICPDMPGRGKSDWFHVKEDYDYPVYCAAVTALIARLRVDTLDWVGTSMGGMIGILLAAMPNAPIRKLVLNDVGPFISRDALRRIAKYVGADPHFDTLEAFEAYVREVNAPFGNLTDAQWKHIAHFYRRHTEDGRFAPNYDPNISWPLKKEPLADVDLFPVYRAVRCPTLLLRGAESDVLLSKTAHEMQNCGPKATLVEFEGIGHVPTLMSEDQIGVVRDWLLSV
uniref:Pimeloyl-ACP methyl ester carboxylesterase n=1 Tax=Candidatus Kentrum eta TaxID=2126337 RepID=A0A450VHX0_9GAMM|nr:MAG: Pimeloyl-ACP methyl ester carboxylesterase [Candidatus Kentron sp. H]VFK04458.1 MAG: Pimeloyl-ACP methyl ester carboxylesterase [Candidatus Kentron sp. H]VFK07592.1 MAG: Pimeloyl-ACP methyl ester carboxylesterase [Candidatus Kentron sp. H]